MADLLLIEDHKFPVLCHTHRTPMSQDTHSINSGAKLTPVPHVTEDRGYEMEHGFQNSVYTHHMVYALVVEKSDFFTAVLTGT